MPLKMRLFSYYSSFIVALVHFYTSLICLEPVCGTAVPKYLSESRGSPKTLYLSQHCRTVIWNLILDHDYVFLDDQAYVMAHPLSEINNGPAFIKQGLCVVTFAAPPGHQLLLHLLDVAIDYRPSHKSRLYIFDGFNAEVKISPYTGLYGETKTKADTFTNVLTKDYLSHYQALTLVFSGSLSKRFYGFKAVLTPVRRPYHNGTCAAGLHLCLKNQYCIDRSLVCNNVPNCGDRDDSDEGEQCNVNAKYHLSHTSLDDLGLMIGCGVSVLVLLLAVIWVAVLIQKRQRLRQERLHLRAATQQSPPVQQGMNYARQPLSDHAMWFPYQIPRGLYQWICPDAPPPAYSESGNNQQACFDMPPPYSQAVHDSQRLVQVQNAGHAEAASTGNDTTASNIQHTASPPAYNDIDQGSVQPLLSENREATLENPNHVHVKDDDEDTVASDDNQLGNVKEQVITTNSRTARAPSTETENVTSSSNETQPSHE